MTTEELLQRRMSEAVEPVVPRRLLTVEDLAREARAAQRRTRRERSFFGTVGVFVTAAAVALAVVGLPASHDRPKPVAPTAVTVTTSAQLLAIVRPIVTKLVKSYGVADVIVSGTMAGHDPTVSVSTPSPRPMFPGPSIAAVEQPRFVSLTVTLHAFRIDPGDVLLRLPGDHMARGSWPGGVRWASADQKADGLKSGSSLDAERVDNVSVTGSVRAAEKIRQSGMTIEPTPLVSRLPSMVRALASALPPFRPLPTPPPIPWVIGPADPALRALTTAAAHTADPAATAQVLYLRAAVVDPVVMAENDIEEIWFRRDDQSGAYFASGTFSGKWHAGYSGGWTWGGAFGGANFDWNGARALPASVKALQDMLYRGTDGTSFRPSGVFEDIAGLLKEGPLSPSVQAALAVVAGRLPGVKVTAGVTDPLGRPAISLEVPSSVVAGKLYVSAQDGTFLALAELDKNRQVKQYRAQTEIAAVPAIRVRPDGTVPHK